MGDDLSRVHKGRSHLIRGETGPAACTGYAENPFNTNDFADLRVGGFAGWTNHESTSADFGKDHDYFTSTKGSAPDINMSLAAVSMAGAATYEINMYGASAQHKLWNALTSDFRLVNVTDNLDLDIWFPIHVILAAGYVTNLGSDKDDVVRRTENPNVKTEPDGYHIGLTVGYPKPLAFGDWNVFIFYKPSDG